MKLPKLVATVISAMILLVAPVSAGENLRAYYQDDFIRTFRVFNVVALNPHRKLELGLLALGF